MKIKKISLIIAAILCCASMIVGLCSCDNSGEKGNDDKVGTFGIVYNDTTIELDKSAAAVLENLGEPKYADDLGDCGGIGVQTKYTYDDITVNTLKEKDGEKIHKISFISDLVETSKGISIGDTADDVKEAYGSSVDEDGEKLICAKGKLRLEFTVKGGAVTAINYLRIV